MIRLKVNKFPTPFWYAVIASDRVNANIPKCIHNWNIDKHIFREKDTILAKSELFSSLKGLLFRLCRTGCCCGLRIDEAISRERLFGPSRSCPHSFGMFHLLGTAKMLTHESVSTI
jgi:hypothetical protein